MRLSSQLNIGSYIRAVKGQHLELFRLSGIKYNKITQLHIDKINKQYFQNTLKEQFNILGIAEIHTNYLLLA